MTKADIQLIRSLDDKRSREDAGLFVAEGAKLVRELLASPLRVRKIYHTGEDIAGATGVETERVPAKEMGRISRLKTPADCLALVVIPRRTPDPGALRDSLTLALDGVQNPGNMGTIIRLADWFGITDILCSDDSADCWGPKVVQATMGALARVRVHYGDLGAMITAVTGEASTPDVPAAAPTGVYGTFLEGENLYDATLSPSGIVVLGSEGRGISPRIERLVTRRLFIPPRRPVPSGIATTDVAATDVAPESLNVAIAAAIVCSEFRRR
jgi:TrmH family RNA methyltransferase